MRVRGLKHRRTQHTALGYAVAPHAGAWIETTKAESASGLQTSHPMRVRGLKQTGIARKRNKGCRTPCGCVD